jgi:integrase
LSRKSSKAGRVVRRTLADGSVRTYRYAPYRGPQKKGDTLNDLLSAWEGSPEWANLRQSTREWYTRSIRPLVGMGSVTVEKISRREITDIRNAIGNGAATAFVRAASALFGWARENGWLEHSPVTGMKRLKSGHWPAWTDAEAAVAIERLPEHLRRVVVLALYTGQRRGDLSALTWRQYDGAAITLTQQKTRTPVRIPCHPVLKAELDGWRTAEVTGIAAAPLLCNALGRPWRPNDLSLMLARALSRIEGFPTGKNLHGIRKLAAANLAEAGCSPHEIAAITGHKSLAMVELYTASVRQEKLAEAAIRRLLDQPSSTPPKRLHLVVCPTEET